MKVEKIGELAIDVEGDDGDDDVAERTESGGVEGRDEVASGDPYVYPSVPKVVAAVVNEEPGSEDMRV